MNLSLVRAFVAVAEARSFTAAARGLGVPTSSVSRGIARLEQALGTKLFDRTTRKSVLSASGRVYYQYASKALEALREGETQVSELLGQPRGEVKLTVPINLDSGFLARQLVSFSQTYPQVRLRVVPTNRWVDMTQEGFDIALRIQQRYDDTLSMHELGSFHAWLVAARSYLKSHGRPRRPHDLTQHRFVNMQSYRLSLRLIGPGGGEVADVEGSVIANDMHLARQLVEQGAGIGPLIFSPGERPSLGKALARVLPDYIVEGPKLFVATAARKSLPLRVRLLREFLIDAYAVKT